MPSTNDYGPKRVVLYTRVSGDEQKKKGYSLRDQRHALRTWASQNGCAVVEEIEDAGYSGAYLEHPGLDRVREMVRGGAADAVVVLFRDRIARGVYAQLLAEEFRAKSAVLQEANEKATINLEAVRSRRARVEDFERDKEALLEYHARLIPEDLDGLTPEQRQTLYRIMRLRVLARDGALTTAEWGCNVLTTPPDSCRTRGR
jgi:DNA invertase Pin-like site-specific DNA recombinase